MGASLTLAGRVRALTLDPLLWRRRTPLLPDDLARLVTPDDPEWLRLDDLRMGRVGDANRARYRIAAAITRGLVPLRAAEAGRAAFRDPTRPTTAVAAYPGGVVPDDVP